MAKIQSIFRPVLITCTIKPAWMAIDRIGMRYNVDDLRIRKALAGLRPDIVARNGSVLAEGVGLEFRYANLALHVMAIGPADVRQGISQHVLGARIDGN